MKTKQFVCEITKDEQIDAPFVVFEKKLMDFSSQKRAGEKFMLLRLQDKTGMIKSVIWEEAEKISPYVQVDDVVWVSGKTQDYKGVQIVIDSIKAVDKQEIDLTPFLPSSKRGEKALYQELCGYINQINNEYIKTLLMNFIEDSQVGPALKKVPAGRKVHHNYLHGLMEHSLEVIRQVDTMYQLYPDNLNRDLLIAGAILHDVGKVREFDLSSPSFNLTDRGKLLGHITLGEELLQEKIAEIPEFPEEIALELRHMIISHHGEKEWGSPEVPKTFNAYCLFYGDLVSSRLNQVEKLINDASEEDSRESWTDFDPLLGRAFFMPQNPSPNDQLSLDNFGLKE